MAGLFNKVPTDLDLNGPILSITTEPTGVTGIGTTVGATGGASVSITGVATAVVGSSGTGGTGYLSYQWYEEGVGALSNGTYITGTASTGAVGSTSTLTLSNLVTPTDNDRKFYLEVDYVPSYTVGVQSVTKSGYTTGNAWNEPITSGVATVTVSPLIDIVAQPTNRQVFLNTNTSVNVNSDLTDSSFSDDLTYQWILDGEDATDGVKTTTTTTSGLDAGTIEVFYNQPGTHTFPTVLVEDVEITVAGGGGGDGALDGGGPGGLGAGGSAGKFNISQDNDGNAENWVGKTINFFVGQRGNSGNSGSGSGTGGAGAANLSGTKTGTDGGGGEGGNAGPSGWSGGGGGGGAATYVEDSTSRFIVAGGGGGGGGGSHNVAGTPAPGLPSSSRRWDSINGDIPEQGNSYGGDGSNSPSDGGGGGGGGGGAPGGGGGNRGIDNGTPSQGGYNGQSMFSSDRVKSLGAANQWTQNRQANGYVNLKYTGYTENEVTTTRKTTISGSTSSTLILSSDTVGVQTCMCKISSATASNSPIYTDTVNVVFNSKETNNNINVEGIGIGLTATLSTLNLSNGDFTLQTSLGDVSTGQINNEWVLYSPDKDMDVEMDLYGGQGNSATDNNGVASSYEGGEGGYSRIRFTMKQNEEYVIAGLTTSINTPYVYHKGTLIACVGQGGQAGLGADGGDGGGIDINGARGGNNGGNGGDNNRMISGSRGITLIGDFGSSVGQPPLVYTGDSWGAEGGRTISCTKGVFYATIGIGACDDIGTGRFRLSGGEEVTNTTTAITRGYKAGYNVIQTAGQGFNNAGRGGNGATGGAGGGGLDSSPLNSGGGGGSGYTDGSITVVSATLGGSTGDGKVVLRLQS